MKELKLAWRYVRRHWWQYILGILALFIVDEVNTYVPRFTGEITNGLDQHTLDMGGVMGLVWKIVLIGVIIAVGRFAWRFFLFGSARSIEKELRSDLFAHLSTLSPHYYNGHKTGDLMARFINDLQAVRALVGMNVISTFDATVMLLLVLWQMMTYVSPKLTGVAVLPLILIIFGDYFYGKVMHKRFLAKQQAFSTLTDQVQETVSGIRVIKSFVQERKELYAFAKTTLFTKEKEPRRCAPAGTGDAAAGLDCRYSESADAGLRRLSGDLRRNQHRAVYQLQFLCDDAGVADDGGGRVHHERQPGSGEPAPHSGDFDVKPGNCGRRHGGHLDSDAQGRYQH